MLLLFLVTKSCLTLCDPLNYSMPGFPDFTVSWSLLKFLIIESVMPANCLILCYLLLLLPSVFPSIRVFSSELALCIRWPKYWSFRFSIILSNEYSGLISFRIDCCTNEYLNVTVCKNLFPSYSLPSYYVDYRQN